VKERERNSSSFGERGAHEGVCVCRKVHTDVEQENVSDRKKKRWNQTDETRDPSSLLAKEQIGEADAPERPACREERT